jgi:hypothetical protein
MSYFGVQCPPKKNSSSRKTDHQSGVYCHCDREKRVSAELQVLGVPFAATEHPVIAVEHSGLELDQTKKQVERVLCSKHQPGEGLQTELEL